MLLAKSVLTIYNPRNEDPKELIDNFVIRTKEYESIINDIKSSDMKYPEQNYIIQGQRGYGKTTLLLRLYYEILEDEVLNKKIYPIIFTEEQYNIRTLAKLWEHIIDYLEEIANVNGIYDQLKSLNKHDEYEAKCFSILENYLKDNNKKIILFIDNIGYMFDKFTEKENHRLREILLTSPEIRIIGGSAEVLEYTYDYSKPFFDFFKIINLKNLNKKETESLLLKLSEKFGNDEKEYIEDIIKSHSGRIESLRRLTGGVPRTIVLLFEVFIDNKSGNSFQDLEMVLDRVTPLYKHRMDDLSTNQQAIVDAIAMNWDAISTKFIAEETGMESKIVSAQLRELEKNRIVRKIETSTKNHLYQISERFFNIWYLMRYGRKKDKNKVQWLVQFLEIWCDNNELNRMALKHLDLIKQGKLHDKYALYMTEAYSRTKIDSNLQDRMIQATKKLLETKSKNLLKELSISDKDLIVKAFEYLKNTDFKKALLLLNEVKNKDATISLGIPIMIIVKSLNNILANNNDSSSVYNIGLLYNIEFKDYKLAEKYYLMASDRGDSDAMSNLGSLYDLEFKDYKLAEKYYLMAVSQGNSNAMVNLGCLYAIEFKDYKLAEKYYLMAVNQGDSDSMFCLGILYETEFKDYKLAEKYYLMAVNQGNLDAIFNLAILYHMELKDFKLAEKYYLMASDRGKINAFFSLGCLYHSSYKNIELAEKYYLMASNKGIPQGMFGLGALYDLEFKDYKLAEKYYLMASDKGDFHAMDSLGELYEREFKDYKLAEKYYLMAIDNGNPEALFNLSNLYYNNNFNKIDALNYAEKAYKIEKNHYELLNLMLILLWNNKINESTKKLDKLLNNKDFIENNIESLDEFILLLIAKKQYNYTHKIFENKEFNFKDRFKPIYYALMYFMQDKYPDEYKKMGDELKQTVEEIIKKINQLAIDYA